MYRAIYNSVAIVLLSSSVAAAEVKTGTFVCGSTQAVGFLRDEDGLTWMPKNTETWRPVSFILTIERDPNTDAGYEANLSDLSQGKKLEAYRITVTTKGSTTPMECKDTILTDAKKGANRFVFYSGTNAEFGCEWITTTNSA
ncbi:hypothetical protein ACCS55_34960 [Rhizobium ruizarguesonis]